ncbi:MAG: S9 family peptidase [Thermoanaerobaculia bacterium]
MKRLVISTFALLFVVTLAPAQVPESIVTRNVPEISPTLAQNVVPYLEYRSASFRDWHPTRREMLISTRFADTPQIHLLRTPLGARRQLTFYADRVGGAVYQPKSGDYFVFSKDTGGGEFYQIYRYDLHSGQVTLLTDGKSRNGINRFSRDGKWLAYASTRRNGRDSDIRLIDPVHPETDRMFLQLEGGGWGVADFSPDGTKLAVGKYISANQSVLYLADFATGKLERLTPEGKVLYGGARFSADGKSIFLTTDASSEFSQLARLDLATRRFTPLTPNLQWDVDEFELSPDGSRLAFVTNEDGVGVLHMLDTQSGHEVPAPRLPIGTVRGLSWHPAGNDLAFTLTSAKSPSDVFSVEVSSGKLERWTSSETGGLDTSRNVEPELVHMKSFDGVEISAFVYRPDPAKFPGARPAIISIHGGPEGQYQPGFLGRNNYFLNEMGIALVYPNVRGSSGYGKTYLTLDNGFKREDSVRDIGTVIDWARTDPKLDGARIAVMGGSYGGYMTLASLTHYSDRLRAGVDVVGISNFVTFLKNTQDYRRDLRRVEYGDEREPKMNEFLQKVSPLTNVAKIRVPLMVVQGFNDPRVPYTESEQIVKAVGESGLPVWYIMAKDEGHGFGKKVNADYQFLATIAFLQEHLLK